MPTLRVYRVLSRIPVLGYGGKAVALAALAAAIPFALMIGLIRSPSPLVSLVVLILAAVAAGVSLLILTSLGAFLSAIEVAAGEIRDCARLAGAPERQGRTGDALTAMLSDIRYLSGAFKSVRNRLANRHPVTGVATREPLLAAIAGDLKGQVKTATLGVIRFAQFQRLAAVDRAGADEALRTFARRLTQAIGPSRPVAQVDRDAFAVWFCDPAGPMAADAALKDLAKALAQPIGDGDERVVPDVRMGAAVFPGDGADGPALLDRAVAALAKSSRSESGRLAFFSEETAAAARQRFNIEQALRKAITRGELALHYQPVIDLTSARVVGAEALLRWFHPDLGPVPPARFIPVLEQSGLMDEVGPWILDTACKDACDFESLGLNPFKVGVNLSQRQFRDPDLAAKVGEALQRSGLKPHRLELELTEAALMENLDHTRRVFEELGAIGVSLALDDYGAGASSLGDLSSFPFAKLKIDRAFVADVAARHDSQAVCAAAIELGRRLDIAVLAEGVETAEEAEALSVMGCTLVQGFFFARPLAADKFKRKTVDPEWLALLAAPGAREVIEPRRRMAG